MTGEQQRHFMREAIALAQDNMDSGEGGPFGAIIVKNNHIIARGVNRVTRYNDPTAHAEIEAIRHACHDLRTWDLSGCFLFSSCEPCPMCLGAIYWAHINACFFAADRHDAAEADFDDALIYNEITSPLHHRSIPFIQLLAPEGAAILSLWKISTEKIPY